MRRGRAVVIALGLVTVLPACRLTAQCPDGTPPPCGRVAARANPRSVAVLYFDNLSRDTSVSYLADGLTEEVIATLGKVHRLDVKSLYASQQFRDRPATSPAVIGRALGAAYLVRGSVRPSAGRVRVTYELIRAASGAHVAGDVLDRSSAELTGAPGDIAAAVTVAIAGPLTAEEQAALTRRPTQNAEAHDLYLRALHAADSWSQQGPEAALAYLDRAIALDSSFAPAYAAEADAWNLLADAFMDPRVAYARSRAASGRALALDSTLALAWAMMGISSMTVDMDGPEAMRYAERALALDPHLGWGHLARSAVLAARGRITESLEAARNSYLSDTLDAVGAGFYLLMLYEAGATDSLAALLPRVPAALGPDDQRAYAGLLAFARGDYAAAARQLDWHYYGGWLAGEYVGALRQTGRADAARATVDSMVAASAAGWYNPLAIARGYAELGNRDEAFRWLDRAVETRTQWLFFLPLYRDLAPLRSDPRYAAVTSHLRL